MASIDKDWSVDFPDLCRAHGCVFQTARLSERRRIAAWSDLVVNAGRLCCLTPLYVYRCSAGCSG